MEYKKNGICDAYIKFGYPELNDIVQTIQTKSEIEMSRLSKLLRRLRKEDEEYDENNTYYKKYIKDGGDINFIISEGIKEWFYIKKTNYLELLKLYKSEDIAQSKAYNQYIKQHGSDKYTERIRKTELVMRLY
jgi:Zn-finger nucleic acid-binding protein